MLLEALTIYKGLVCHLPTQCYQPEITVSTKLLFAYYLSKLTKSTFDYDVLLLN